jgi:hypothetical protein
MLTDINGMDYTITKEDRAASRPLKYSTINSDYSDLLREGQAGEQGIFGG